MILQAFSDYALLREGSFLIGDRQSDIDAALAAGLPGYLFQEGNLDEFLQKILAHRGEWTWTIRTSSSLK